MIIIETYIKIPSVINRKFTIENAEKYPLEFFKNIKDIHDYRHEDKLVFPEMVFSSKSLDYYTNGVLFIKNGKFSISFFDSYDLIMPQWWNFIVGIGEIIEENKQKTELRYADMDACLTVTKQRDALLIEKKYGKTIKSCHLVDEKEFIITFLNAAQLYHEFAKKYFTHTNLGKEKEYVEDLLKLYKDK